MRWRVLLLIGSLGMASILCAQTSTTAVSLKATTKVEVSLSRQATLSGQAMCDGAGNVYVRQQYPETAGKEVLQLPVQEITFAGAIAGRFRVTDAFPSGVLGTGFFVDHEGKIYELAMAGDGVYVVAFRRDGSVQAKTKLETGSRLFVSPSQLAVFKSGGYLLAAETGKTGNRPYTAVFAADGRLVKEIYEPEDDDARQNAEIGDTQYAGPANIGNTFVTMGDVAAGSDGDVYLLRQTPRSSPILIYAISPSGAVVRKLRIDSGDDDLVARSIRSYAGRLAIGFDSRSRTDKYHVKVIDLKGNSIAEYVGAMIGADPLALACYSSEGLTMVPYFAKPDLYLLRAKLP